ncbi:3-oxoacyl-[acyl-carrier-protein] reductase FabG [Planktothrix tepida]|uniref:Oxidoreductase n=2 Tax=Planktothrix TaxID=54304 RepID=A0A1J1LFG1_9CYAN|nr:MULTISPECIES: SDR family oxidoreductase [Planktothrix]CAD5934006.1 3-oxoacyl-[acyl-carrier-protein] reductase FabG [Planktothrix pseudagardhii]CAD5976121.1 3-oxoacyl-[acyl-carrier-protein] reductase FabG [Planktothrix tepida]CUR30297.1 Oxidoreductase [Planktothrix tepida PCC 9214]
MTSTVLITGASQGSGKATALLFAQKGYNVILAAREPERLEAVAEEVLSLGVSTLAIPTDVTDIEQVRYLVEKALDYYETLDVLVNNAGICLTASVEHTTLEDWHLLMNTNFFGYVNLIHALLPHFLAQKQGTIVNVGSFGGKIPFPQMAAYCASKYAVVGLTESLRLEVQKKGIQVCAVHPGIINSNFMERAQFRGENELEVEQLRQRLDSALASTWVSQPEDIAQAIWNAVEKKQNEVIVGSAVLATETYRLFPGLMEWVLNQSSVMNT